MGRVIGECGGLSGSALADLFIIPGRSLASRIAELQPIALDLVFGLLGTDPDKADDQPAKPAAPNAKPISLVEQCEDLFGFATGILNWTPAEAWDATPGEIMAAAKFRQKANAPTEGSTAKKPLTLDQQGMLLAARLDARAS